MLGAAEVEWWHPVAALAVLLRKRT
jgi:hypothetical protein